MIGAVIELQVDWTGGLPTKMPLCPLLLFLCPLLPIAKLGFQPACLWRLSTQQHKRKEVKTVLFTESFSKLREQLVSQVQLI